MFAEPDLILPRDIALTDVSPAVIDMARTSYLIEKRCQEYEAAAFAARLYATGRWSKFKYKVTLRRLNIAGGYGRV